MIPSIDVSITCDNDCINWCPRKLICCSDNQKSIDESQSVEVKTKKVAQKNINHEEVGSKKSGCQII